MSLNSPYRLLGSLEFHRQPLIKNLGNINIDTLYDNAWMLYHSRDINGDVEFEELHLAEDILAKVRASGTKS